MSQQVSATPTNRSKSFDDRMVELSTGVDLLIDRLDKVFNAGLEFPTEQGADVMNACMEAQWIANRLSEDIHVVGCEFDQDDSQPSLVKFKQVAE